MNITDEQVRVALDAMNATLKEGRGNADTKGVVEASMRAALTAFLSSVGGEPVGEVTNSSDGPVLGGRLYRHVPLGAKLYTAEDVASRVAGGGEPVYQLRLKDRPDHWHEHSESNYRDFAHPESCYEYRILYTHPATARAGVRYLTQRELDMMGVGMDGLDGNQWDRMVQARFAEVNGLALIDANKQESGNG